MTIQYSRRKLGISSITILVGNIIGQFIGYIYLVILARKIGLQDYGYFSLVISFTSLFSSFAVSGLNRTIVRFVSIYFQEQKYGHVKGVIVFIGFLLVTTSLLMALILSINAEYISKYYFNSVSFVPILRLFIWIIPTNVVLNFILEVFRGIGEAEYRTYMESIIQKPIKLILVLFNGINLNYIIVLELFVSIIGVIFSFILLFNKVIKKISKFEMAISYKEIIIFSLPMIPGSLLSSFGNQTEPLVMGWFGQVAEVGIFNAALRIASFGAVILLAYNSTFAPMISSLCEHDKLSDLKKLFETVTRWQMMIITGWFAVTVLFSSDLVALFGKDFLKSQDALVILSARQMTDAILGPVGLIITMGGKGKLTLINNLVFLVMGLLFDILLIPYMGAYGAAISVLMTSIMFNVIVAIQVWKIYKVQGLSVKNIVFPLVLTAFSYSIIYTRHYFKGSVSGILEIVISMFIFCIMYSVLLLNWMEEDEKYLLVSKLRYYFSKYKRSESNV